MKIQETNHRIEYVDVFKGIGIILMILGHIPIGGIYDFFIHAFNMPMFFFASGYFFKNRSDNFKLFITKKIKSILVPYLLFGLFHYSIWLMLMRNQDGIDIFVPLKYLLLYNDNNLPIAGALWFLTALFFTELIYQFLNKLIKNNLILSLIIFPIMMIGQIIPLFGIRLLWTIDISFVAMGFYHIGRMFSEYKLENKIEEYVKNKKIVLILIPISVFLIFANGYINMRTAQYSNLLLFWINALLMVMNIWYFAKWIYNRFSKSSYISGLIKYIQSIGCNSIVYLCLNQFVILVCSKMISYFSVANILREIVMFVTVMFGLMLLTKFLNLKKLRFIIGK